MSAEPTIERIRVRYGETDKMGHAYYANYFFWFEQARGAWCRARGFTYKQLEELGYMLPCVEACASYKDAQSPVRRLGSKSNSGSANSSEPAIRFDYEIVNESTGKLCTTGHTWHVFVGKERKAVTVPPEIREWLTRDGEQ